MCREQVQEKKGPNEHDKHLAKKLAAGRRKLLQSGQFDEQEMFEREEIDRRYNAQRNSNPPAQLFQQQGQPDAGSAPLHSQTLLDSAPPRDTASTRSSGKRSVPQVAIQL